MFERHPIRERLRKWSQDLPGSRWYVVGGAVRDALLKRPLKDIDVLVAGVEPVALGRFLEARGQVDFVGRTFGVFKFRAKGDESDLDIALPRREKPIGTGGYRDVAAFADPKMPVEEDLSRRDFTVNAMAWDASTGKVIDPFDGAKDVKRKIIRAVGTPGTRFQEDYTRMLRALRFATQLGFRIEPKTWSALRRLMKGIEAKRRGERVVPYELISRELLKSLDADSKRALKLWRESGALKTLLPGLKMNAALSKRLAKIGSGEAEAGAAALLFDLGAARAKTIALRLRLPAPEHLAHAITLAAEMKRIGADVWRPSRYRLVFITQEKSGQLAMTLARALGVRTEPFEKRLKAVRARAAKPFLDGDRIMAIMGLKPGPVVKEAIDLLIDMQTRGTVRSPAEAEAFFKKGQ